METQQPAQQGAVISEEVSRAHPWAAAFLSALQETPNVAAAARAAGVAQGHVYRVRKECPAFAREWAAAWQAGVATLEQEAIRRARDGWLEQATYKGEPTFKWVDRDGNTVPKGTAGARQVPFMVRRFDGPLLALLLKAKAPEEFKDRSEVRLPGLALPTHADLDAPPESDPNNIDNLLPYLPQIRQLLDEPGPTPALPSPAPR
jgi:hypothetical protein